MAPKRGERGLDWRHLRVGILALVGLAMLAFGVYKVGEVFDVFADRYQLITPVPSVAGLREGAPVTLAGQRVGQVVRIEFIPIEARRDTNRVRIALSISQDVQEQIRADSYAYIRTQGLLGDKYVDITPGSAQAAVLQEGQVLPAGETVDIDVILARAAETLDTAQVVMTALTRVTEPLSRGEGSLGRLLTDDALYTRLSMASGELGLFVRDLRAGRGTLGRLATDDALYHRLDGAVTRVDSVAAAMIDGEGTIGRLLRDDTLYHRLVGTAERAETALANLADLFARVNDGDGTLGRLLTDQSLYDEALKAIVDLQYFIQAIRQDPSLIRPEVNVDVF